MKKSYKKRAKVSYNTGKSYKEESNRSERQYVKTEITKELEIIEQGDEFREKSGKNKNKKKTERERLEKKLASDQKYLDKFRSYGHISNYDFLQSQISRLEDDIRKTKRKIESLN